jgi:hypothetical protein
MPVTIMNQSASAASGGKIIETMVELARCSKLHRIIVAGSKSLSHMFELRDRGYNRVVTAACYNLRRGGYDVGLLDWRLQQIDDIEAKLSWLAPTSVLVVWLDAGERAEQRKLGSILAKQAFRVEAGTLCEHGLAIAARRQDANQQAIATQVLAAQVLAA